MSTPKSKAGTDLPVIKGAAADHILRVLWDVSGRRNRYRPYEHCFQKGHRERKDDL